MKQWIKELMDTDITTIDCDIAVAEVERLLAENRLQCLPVLNPDYSVFGLVTSMEVMRFLSNGGNALVVHAWEICETRPCLLRQDSTIEDAMLLYMDSGCRYLTVIDDRNRFVGMVTADTLLKPYLERESVNEQPGYPSRDAMLAKRLAKN